MVVVVGMATLVVLRRQMFCFFAAVHVKRPAVVVRTLPTFLQVVPAMFGAPAVGADAATDTGAVAADVTAMVGDIDGVSACSGVAIGRMPVSAAAPTLMVWHTMHMAVTVFAPWCYRTYVSASSLKPVKLAASLPGRFSSVIEPSAFTWNATEPTTLFPAFSL